MQKVARQFASILADAELPVRFQVGEPWYWIDFRDQKPCFYDPATVAAWTAVHGAPPPIIDDMKTVIDPARLAFLDWLGSQLAASVLAIHAAVRADHPNAMSYALLYLPQLLDAQTPEAHRVNMPVELSFPALDILQLEDYDFVIANRLDLSATGRGVVERTLGYPRSRQEYFAGFALFKDTTGTIWRASTNALASAAEWGVAQLYIWAYTQVCRDSYVPGLKSAPALRLADLSDVELARNPPDDGDLVRWSASDRAWIAQSPRRTFQVPDLSSPWINYGGGSLGARYSRSIDGFVNLEGVVQAPSGSAVEDVLLFTLLPGFRPSGSLIFVTWSGAGACRVDVLVTGDVILRNGNSTFTSLNGICFLADA